MNPKIDNIAIGVTHPTRAREFYEQAFGCRLGDERAEFVTLTFGAEASRLVLRPWDALAADAGVPPESSGFRAFTLSYICDSADRVDQVLARVVHSGGEISKPPRRAFWGYSAYVTDPSGHLWKVASPKRRPLLARNGSAASAEQLDAVAECLAREVPLTIGAADIKRAKEFYKDGLGLSVKKDYRKFISFDGGEGTSDLALYTREALAKDAAVPPAGTGFPGFSMTHFVGSSEGVDGVLEAATQAGGKIVKPPLAASSGAYGGHFTDPDGFLWQVTTR